MAIELNPATADGGCMTRLWNDYVGERVVDGWVIENLADGAEYPETIVINMAGVMQVYKCLGAILWILLTLLSFDRTGTHTFPILPLQPDFPDSHFPSEFRHTLQPSGQIDGGS